MSDLSCYITTFNCGRAPVDVDFFAASLFNGLTTTNDIPPDLLVLALQEIAPIGHSFVGGLLLSSYFTRFVAAVQRASAHRFGAGAAKEYGLITTEHVGMTGIIVFARPEVQAQIRHIDVAGVGVGHWEMGNKGAVGVRLTLEDGTEQGQNKVTFVAAHLAPAEDQCERRNRDWQSICEGLVFERKAKQPQIATPVRAEETEPLLSETNASEDRDERTSSEQHTLFSPPSHIFFAGDLNYRTADVGPQPSDSEQWPSSLNDPSVYTALFKRDQLTRERTQQHTLHHLTEAEIHFTPTYKYSSAAQAQAVRLSAQQVAEAADSPPLASGLWAKHRVPSWCDRILYSAAAAPAVHAYTSLPVQPTSDHRPVVLACSLPRRSAAEMEALKPPFAVRQDWQQARAAARRLELAVGVAAYLTVTREGQVLLAGSVVGIVGGYLVLRALIGG